jgi:cytochrome P450
MRCPAGHDAGDALWVVDDPGDVRTVLLDPVTFPPDNALTAHTPLAPAALRILASAGFALPPALANNASATHRPIRRLVAGFFSPARVAAVEPRIRELALGGVAAVGEALDLEGRADLVPLLADAAPMTVLLELLGLDDFDAGPSSLHPPALKRWSKDSLELFWGWPDPDRQAELAASAAEFYEVLRHRVRVARRAPGQDLFGRLAALGLSDREICGTAYFLLVAGHETTSQLIATALLRLVQGPQWRALGAGAEDAVERVLREESSVPAWRRTTAAAVTIAGQLVPAGAEVLVRLTGTGAQPDLAFGVGPHRCLGAGLARLETRVVLEVAAAALPDLVCVEPDPPRTELLSFAAPDRVIVARGSGSARRLAMGSRTL